MAWWRGYDYFSPSRPREAKGGIKAQSKRGTFGESWWARRWIEELERANVGISARLGRGRSYARRGQVLSIRIGKGTASAEVQGSRPKPYDVQIKVATLSKGNWNRVIDALRKQALFAAKLLAGEMPQQIGDVFRRADLSLFPAESRDLRTECSCPDWSNPCKHIAAVYYLLGEEFDRDPFLIFRLRGIEREDLISRVSGAVEPEETAGRKQQAAGRRHKATGKGTGIKATRPAVESPQEPASVPVPLPQDPITFWGTNDSREDRPGEVRIPPVAAALPRRLGNFPFWRGEAHLMDTLESIYRGASAMGMAVFLGEISPERED